MASAPNGTVSPDPGNTSYINPDGTVHSPSHTLTVDSTMKEDLIEERLEEQLDERLEDELEERIEDEELGLDL